MEKILLALDAHRLSTNTIEFACYVAQRTHSKLTGLLLERVRTATPLYIAGSGDAPYGDGDPSDVIDTQTIRRFRQLCMDRHTLTDVHLGQGTALSEIVLESRYASLLIIDPDTTFSRVRSITRQFIEDVLLQSGCPVLVAPHDLRTGSEIVIIYRDDTSSFNTVRQFADLFDGLAEKKLTLVTLYPPGISQQAPPAEAMQWLNEHYGQVELVALKDDPSGILTDMLVEKKNALVIVT